MDRLDEAIEYLSYTCDISLSEAARQLRDEELLEEVYKEMEEAQRESFGL